MHKPLDFLLHVPGVGFRYGFVQFLSEKRQFAVCVEITQKNLLGFLGLRDTRWLLTASCYSCLKIHLRVPCSRRFVEYTEAFVTSLVQPTAGTGSNSIIRVILWNDPQKKFEVVSIQTWRSKVLHFKNWGRGRGSKKTAMACECSVRGSGVLAVLC